MASSLVYVSDPIPTLSDREYANITRLAYEHFGLNLGDSKHGLIAARLGKTMRKLGITSFQHYYDYVKADRSGVALAGMVDQLTTNHTSFFREPRHFDFLRKCIYPALHTRPRIHIWSAACSSGEEPYSIAMSLLEESAHAAAAKVRIKATDISTRVLDHARRGVYEADRCDGIPTSLLQRYLVHDRTQGAHSFRFRNDIRSMIEFEHLNLMGSLPEGYRCSVIFCRNIMIYFDKPTQQSLVQRLSLHLEDGGYLLIGHSESLNNISHDLNYISPATYRKPGRYSLQAQIGRG